MGFYSSAPVALTTAAFAMTIMGAPVKSSSDSISINPPNILNQTSSKIVDEKETSSGQKVQFLTSSDVDNDLSEKDLVSLIRSIFNREISYQIKFDQEMDVYFFRIYSNEDLFDDDFDKLELSDDKLNKSLYNGKKIIVTLEEQDV